jgi:2-keto-4-pentenoate hydratase/2-oxohepta-3-ene-1,7-dioic acid hydratase in catechol pathway
LANEYRLLSYRDASGIARAGVLFNDRVLPATPLLEGAPGIDSSSVLGLLQSWGEVHPRIAAALGRVKPSDGRPLAEVALLAPILYPGAVFCAGANYWDHMKEMNERQRRLTGKEPPEPKKAKDPWFFIKTGAHSIVGDGANARMPSLSQKLDWEAEIGVVIGKPARNISLERAHDVIAGYTCVNDLSARDLSTQADRAGGGMYMDWLGQKCFDDACPMGPWITPAAFVPDPNDIGVKLSVNGVEKQNSNSKNMIHSIAEQIVSLSQHVTLRPGDVIATGTPAGVGAGRGDSGEFLKAGDEVKVEVQFVGTLTNRMVGAS